ncbi:hypothetical protein DVP43_15930 [Yersinia enterocolitica]|nr:hypothetical protein [Yersinia enterocolitica]
MWAFNWYVVPALASVGFNCFTTFGWVLPRPSLGGWKDSGSFSTHANVECKKPKALTSGFFVLAAPT